MVADRLYVFVATNDRNALYTDDSVALQDPFLNVRVIDPTVAPRNSQIPVEERSSVCIAIARR